jgi:hypothetical protein
VVAEPVGCICEANADTFHFTNCSPQHWRFNESAQFWQGVERYVLENGMLEIDPHKRLCVIQGPVFRQVIVCTGCEAIISGEIDQQDSVGMGPRSSRAHAGSQGWPFRAGSVFHSPPGRLDPQS